MIPARPVDRLLLILAAIATAFSPAPTTAEVLAIREPLVVEDTTSWAGEVLLAAPVTVAGGATLTLLPGTRVTVESEGTVAVTGSLYLQGTSEAPITVTGSKELEQPVFSSHDPAALLRVHELELRGAKSGIYVTGSQVVVTASRFLGNETALAIDLKARAELRDLLFSDNRLGLSLANSAVVKAHEVRFERNELGAVASNSVALHLTSGTFLGNKRGYGQQNPCDARFEHCVFERNEVALELRQTRRSPVISFSRFHGNTAGLLATLFSYPLVEASVFRDNERAFSADQFCGPFLRFNDFRDNREAIRLDKKSSARIEGNRLESNGVALFADFSSYPRVHGNRFADNEWHVRLGIYQSADWEKRQGSQGIMLGAARDAQTRNPFFNQDGERDWGGVFSVAGNSWDAKTAAELQQGPETNVTTFWDGRDQAPVRYEGFGEGEYAVDVVEFLPLARQGQVPVGPEAWVPYREPGGGDAGQQGPPTGSGPPDGGERPAQTAPPSQGGKP